MKFLIVLCATLCCAVAKPQLIAPGWAIPHGYSYAAPSPLGHPIASYGIAPFAYSAHHAIAAPVAAPVVAHAAAPIATAAVVAPVAHKSQYHAQDELGQASYGHSEPTQAHHAVQDAFGNKVGSFSYAAPDGRILRTDYVADALGYRVTSNNLPLAPAVAPLPVQDTPEVALAKAQHFAHHLAAHRIAKRSALLYQTPASTAPLATHAIAAPVAYSAHHAIATPVAAHVAAPVAYSAHHTVAAAPLAAHVAAPVAYSAHHTVAAAPLAAHVAAPVAYSAHHTVAAAPLAAHVAAPVAYSAHHTVAAAPLAAPVAYSAHHTVAAAPIAYSAHHAIAAPVAAPVAYAAAPAVAAGPVLRDATLTTVVNTPGHAVSYRVD